MEYLFVCNNNVGRSQMAEARFNAWSGLENRTRSAGVRIGEKEGRLLDKPLREQVVAEIGIDVSEHIRTQLTPDLVERADKVIACLDEAEIPAYLSGSGKLELWNDVPAMVARTWNSTGRGATCYANTSKPC